MQTTQLTQLLHQRQLSFFRKFQNERPEYYISAGTELRGVLDNFWFHGNVCAVAQRAFVDFCCGFDLPLDHSEREAACFTVDECWALSFFNLADHDIFAVTPRTFINVCFGVNISLD